MHWKWCFIAVGFGRLFLTRSYRMDEFKESSTVSRVCTW